MTGRELIKAILDSKADLDRQAIISLDTEGKGYEQGADMTPQILEVFDSGMTIYLRTWKR